MAAEASTPEGCEEQVGGDEAGAGAGARAEPALRLLSVRREVNSPVFSFQRRSETLVCLPLALVPLDY